MDKVYEVIVYALFSTLVEKLGLQVEVSVDVDKLGILSEFLDFAKMIMGIDVNIRKSKQKAKIYRVGVANAADKGLDMYSNWGPAIQIKHLTLDVQKAESIVSEISSDRIVIVCQEAEASVILALLSQIGWKSRIQSIVTKKNLVDWYEKALRGKNSDILGSTLLKKMRDELVNEFPHVKEIPEIITSRNYDDTFYPEWTVMM
jgi:type II restriction enzyme